MMLINDTADLLKIKDHKDPMQSNCGGARYFKQRINVMSEEISEPNQTWFGLAAYNVGWAS